MAEDGERRSGALDWVKGLGLPIASLIVSVAFFAVQQQQQAFERKLANIESGYRFYFENRTPLTTSDNVGEETALLKMIGSAFPNIYCFVRADLHERATGAENRELGAASSADAPPFGEADRAALLTYVVNNPAPSTAVWSVDIRAFLPGSEAAPPEPCREAFDAIADQTAPPPETELVADASPAPVRDEASPAPQAAPPPPSAGAGGETVATQAPGRSAAPIDARSAVVRRQVEAAREAVFTRRAETYQVFFHLAEGGARGDDSVDPFREQLARGNFRVMRGSRRVNAADMPRNAQVRYFGPNEEPAARELAAFLSEQYRREGLNFETLAIGDRYAGMPRTHLEVWIPEPRR